jgi:hypothetical protein
MATGGDRREATRFSWQPRASLKITARATIVDVVEARRGGFVCIKSGNFKVNVGRASVALATSSEVSSIAQAEYGMRIRDARSRRIISVESRLTVS